MINTIVIMMSAPFIRKAVLVGTLISLCAALLGVSLVLKRYSMIGDRFITCWIWSFDSCYGFGSYNATLYSNSNCKK